MLELQKAIELCAAPLGTSLVLGIAALAATLLSRRRVSAALLLASIAWLWIWSTPAASGVLRASIERRVPVRTLAELPGADAIVVLGGGMEGALPPWRPYPVMERAGDRAWHAARLYRAGKAPRVVVSGGDGPFPDYTGDEASAMALLLHDLGVPQSALVLEKRSRTTSENATETAKILARLHASRVLLVTSALHMPRALATFRNRGIDAIPAPANVEIVPRPPSFMDWLPRSAALVDSTEAMHEILGMARCRALGC